MLMEDRLPGWDFTASLPKGVTTALEGGDTRIQKALHEAGDESMADVERYAMTRVGRAARMPTASPAYGLARGRASRYAPGQRGRKAGLGSPPAYVVPNATWDTAKSDGRP